MELGLSLGSNLGDRLGNLREARRRIEALPGVVPLACSPVYETRPVGVAPATAHLWFLNAVLIVECAAELPAVSIALHAIEADMGRVRGPDPNMPRVIDIDVIYAGAARQADSALTLPHPRWAGRRFVVQPLADVRPGLRLPGEARTVAEVLAALPDEEGVRRIGAETEWNVE